MKKKLSLLVLCFVLIATSVFGAAGDQVPDSLRGVWTIQSNNYNLQTVINQYMSDMPTGAGQIAIPKTYWVFFMMIYFGDTDIYGKVYPDDTYHYLINRVEGYGYDDAVIGDQFKPPQNESAVGDTITCDEDPTGASREVLLFHMASGNFVQSSITGSLAGGTWTFLSVTGSDNTKYNLAYNDNFESLPTEWITVAP